MTDMIPHERHDSDRGMQLPVLDCRAGVAHSFELKNDSLALTIPALSIGERGSFIRSETSIKGKFDR